MDNTVIICLLLVVIGQNFALQTALRPLETKKASEGPKSTKRKRPINPLRDKMQRLEEEKYKQ